MNILDLPQTLLMDIFEHLSNEELAKKREVCTRFNYTGQQVLNLRFTKIVEEHFEIYKRIKSMQPRPDSEQGSPSGHSDTLRSLETYISMLKWAYWMHMNYTICRFIPGRVLDEIDEILGQVLTSSKPWRPNEVLVELRRIFYVMISTHLNPRPKKPKSEMPLRTKIFYGIKVGPEEPAIVQPAAPLTGTQAACARLNIILRKQYEQQYMLTFMVRRLEAGYEARSSNIHLYATELTDQVLELKGQLEDMLANPSVTLPNAPPGLNRPKI